MNMPVNSWVLAIFVDKHIRTACTNNANNEMQFIEKYETFDSHIMTPNSFGVTPYSGNNHTYMNYISFKP